MTARRTHVDHVQAFLPERRLVVAGIAPGDDDGAPAGPITVAGLAVPWGVKARFNWWGDTLELAPGSITVAEASRVKFLLDHRSKAFGYGESFTRSDVGLDARMTVPRDELDDPEIAAAVRQMGNGVRDALSIGFTITEADESYDKHADSVHYVVTAANLVELSSVLIPMFADARHQPVAATRRWSFAADAEPDDDDDDDGDPADDDDPESEGDEPVSATDTEPDETTRASAHRASVTAITAGGRRPARYQTFGAYARAKLAAGAAWDGTYESLVQAAFVDETTADIAGIVPEQWMTDLVDLMGSVTPLVQAFSQRPLPDAGMVVNEPRVDQGPDVGPVVGEKVDIPSRKVLIGSVPFPVQTFAGGQDISIQALLRSDPSYLDELMRLYAREMAIQIDIAAVAAMLGAIPVGNHTPIADADLNGPIIDASAAILGRTAQLPTVAVLSTSLWVAFGKAVDSSGRPLFPGLSPTNPVGTFDVTSTTGNVRGLNYFVDPWLDADTGVLGITDAFRTRLGAIGTLTADVPGKLGRDVAVYRFATMGVTDARGLQELIYAPGAGVQSSGSTSKANAK